MANYITKIDGNGYPIEQAIGTLKKVEVPTDVIGEFNVEVPKGSYGFGVKRCDSLIEAELKINEGDFFPIDEGDGYSPFVNIQTVKIKINYAGTSPVVLIFTV